MNTDPLPAMPNQQSPGRSMKPVRENERSWREMILNYEMDSIWLELADLAQFQSDGECDIGDKTQDVFLRLLSEQRFSAYIQQNWSEDEIRRELLSLM